MSGSKPVAIFILTFLFFKVTSISAQIIQDFNPKSGAAGSVVNIYGVGFSATPSDNIVHFGAVKAVVTAANANQLTVTVPAGATYQPITATVAGSNLQGTSKQPFDVTYSPTKPSVTPADFNPPVDFTGRNGPLALTVCDIDGDGKPEIITSNGDKTIYILRNTGAGSVTPALFAGGFGLSAGDNPLSVITGDVDGDGKPDIVVVNNNNTVSIYRNTSTPGALSFAPQIDVVINNPTPLKSVVMSDLDGDAMPDLIFCSGGAVNILRNTSAGTAISFAAQKDFAANTSPTSYITVGDIDGDGKPDLAVTNRGNKTFSLFHNKSVQGSIKFDIRLDYSNITDPGYTAESIVITDVDGDGKPEVLTVYTDNTNPANTSFVLVTRYKGPAFGTANFVYDSKFNSDHSFAQVRIADINGDGKPDIFTMDPNNGKVTIQSNISIPGSIAFLNAQSITTGSSPTAFEVADVNGDSKPDIIAVHSPNIISVTGNNPVLNTPTITSFTPATTSTATTVIITGTNFTGATAVSFGNTPVSFTVLSPTSISAQVTTGTTGKVRVTTPAGTAVRDGFKFIAPPNIDYETPKQYVINTSITPLAPDNKGGPIPATIYGETTVVAGNGSVGGNDGTGTAAQFSTPYGITMDLEGNIYLTESNARRVRMISPQGVVTTIAPDAVPGTKYGTGPTRKFGDLYGVVMDADGNLYVADYLVGLIRKITPDGTVTTLAGGNAGIQDGQGTAAQILHPGGMVIDAAGNIYVTDEHNRIRKVSPTGYMSTFVGSGAAKTQDGSYTGASFNVPIGLAMDKDGNIYVAEQTGRVIRKITPNGVVTTIAGNGQFGNVDGTGTAASFGFLTGITIDASGNLYVTDHGLIRKITPAGVVTTVAGGGPVANVTGVGKNVYFQEPHGLIIGPDGNLYVAEGGNRVKKVIATGYTIDKPLPTGLSFDPRTGIISGTPTVLSPPTDYTITGYNKDGSSVKVVNIAIVDKVVVVLPPPPDISYVTPQVYTSKTPIAKLSPTNKGGAVPPNVYGEVSTFAGSGQPGAVNAQGVAASFNFPIAVVADNAGNVYVVDNVNNRIRKISPSGLVTTLAGNGSALSKDGTGNAASFNGPTGLAIDDAGDLYVTDYNSNLIRKVTPAGVVTTIAGNGTAGSAGGSALAASFDGPFGIAVDGGGNIYVSDQHSNKIRKITSGVVTTLAGSGAQGHADGTGSAASFFAPAAIVCDKLGNIYLADQENATIRMITPAGVVTKFAGTGTVGFADGAGTAAKFFYPTGIAIDGTGNIYVADQQNNRIRKIAPDKTVTTIAGTSARGLTDGTTATFNNPTGIAIDPDGHLFVADIGNNLIREISLTGYTIDKPLPPGLHFDPKNGDITGTPVESSPATDYTITAYNTGGSSSTIVNIKVNDYVFPLPALPDIHYVTPQVYTLDNTPISKLFPTNNGGPVTNGAFNNVKTLAGNGAAGSTNGTGAGASFKRPYGIAIDNLGNIYVADEANSLIRKITTDGVVTTLAGSGFVGSSNGTGTAASFHTPFDIVTDGAGNLFVTDLNNQKIRKITPTGVVTDFAGNGLTGHDDGAGGTATFNHPAGIATDNSGNLYVTDSDNNLIRKITTGGTVSILAGSGAMGHADGAGAAASFNGPIGIVVDGNGNVFVADSYNNIIRKITPSGVVTTFAGSGIAGDADGAGTAASFKDPVGLTIDPYGNLYVADAQNNKIRKITPAGVVTTIAGKLAPGSTNGDLAAATFNTPFGIAIDALGNLIIGDANSNLIREIETTKYKIDKPLPPGLVFDDETGSFSGTPTAISPATDYTVTAYNAAGSESTIINIEVKELVVTPKHPPIISYETPQVYTKNVAIADLKPTNTGGGVGPVATLAGSGAVGHADGTGKDATFYGPNSVVTDAAGSVYVADSRNHLIRKVTPEGVVTTFAGSGAQGSADGTGTAASFHNPTWMTIDAAGNIFVSDPDDVNSRIRKITPGGVVTTVVTDLYLPGGIAVDAAGNIYVAMTFYQTIMKITPAGVKSTFAGSFGNKGSVDGTGTGAKFNSPTGMAIDAAGNLYVVDSNSGYIRKITQAGVVTKFAGTGLPGHTDGTGTNASFNFPNGLAIDADGNLYVGDTGNKLVRKITPTGVVTTLSNGVAGGPGPGPAPGFNYPTGVAVDKNGNIYVADSGDNLIRRLRDKNYTIDKALPPGLTFDNKTGIISGTPTAVWPATDYIITAYNGDGSGEAHLNIKVKDAATPPPPPAPDISYVTPNVYTVNTAISPLIPTNKGGAVPPNIYGQVSTFAGNGTAGDLDGTGTAASLNGPKSIATDDSGNIFIGEQGSNTIRKITPSGTVSTLSIPGVNFNGIGGITFDAAGNMYVADLGNNIIWKIPPVGPGSVYAGGGAGANNGPGASATFNYPVGLAFDKQGNLYVADYSNSLIRKITPGGIVSTYAGNGQGSNDGPAATARFKYPIGICIDAGGNLFVTDAGNALIRKITPAGIVSTFAGGASGQNLDGQGTAASFGDPYGITIDEAGNLYVADGLSNLIRKITPQGLVSTIAGNGQNGTTDGTGTAASFHGADDIIYDRSGNLFVADNFNNTVRKISITGYTIDKPLPPGLIFDPKTGEISGTPAAVSPATDYRVTAYNTGGSSSTIVNIKVDKVAVPQPDAPNINYSTPNIYVAGTAITPLAPTNTGGAVPATAYGKTSTFAGNGLPGKNDANGTNASFNHPTDAVTDSQGNIYICDRDNFLIRKITPAGDVSTFAGSGASAVADGQGTAASFKGPEGIAIDGADNIYVADTYANIIRKITPGGLVTTIAGTGATGEINGPAAQAAFTQPQGIVVDAQGNIFVAEFGTCIIRKISAAGNVFTMAGSGNCGFADGLGTAASFNNPHELAVDAAGNVYVADFDNNRVRKIAPDGTVTTVLSNNAQYSFQGVGGVAFDVLGNLYVADAGNNNVIKVEAITGKETVLSSLNTGLQFPLGLTVDGSGNLYAASFGNHNVVKIPTTGYTIDRPLPPGLTFDPTTGIISGTPTQVTPADIYTITAYNEGGHSSRTVNIEIILNDGVLVEAPKISYVTPQNYIVGKVIATLTPRNDGGDVPKTAYGQVIMFAGNGTKGNANGTGTAASFSQPTSVATDKDGNIYIADKDNFLIRKITPDGVTTTFAGNGISAVVNGQGAAASFKGPGGIATDIAGNIYVADTEGNVIRKITPQGAVTTFAGTGAAGDNGGALTDATFNKPFGIAVDKAGNIYVTEQGSCLVRKISAQGAVSNLAGGNSCGLADGPGGTALFDHPQGLAADNLGNVYVADFNNNRVRKIDTHGNVTTFLRSNNFFRYIGIAGIAIDNLNNIYVSDSGNNRIVKIENGTNQVSVLTPEVSILNSPLGVATDANGNLYVANAPNNGIVKVVLTGYAIDKPLPAGLTFDKTTGVISGTPTQAYQISPFTITAYNAGGKSSFTIDITVQLQSTPGNPPNISYQTPQKYYINQTITPLPPISTGSDIPVFEFGQIQTFTGAGNPGYTEGGPTTASYRQPAGVVVDASGNLYVADYLNNVIRKVSPDGTSSTFAGSGQGTFANGKGINASFNHPGSVVLDAAGYLYVADAGNHRIRKIEPDGTVTTFAGSGVAGSANGAGIAASFNTPNGIAIDAAGTIYVADSGNNLIRKISQSGEVTTLAGSGSPGSSNGNGINATFSAPQNLTVDAYGSVYITDMGNNLIRKITSAGDVTTYAGNGSAGGQNGSGLSVSFNKPSGIVVDDIGDLFVSDFEGNLIRMISPAGDVITLVGDGRPGGLNNTGTAAGVDGPKGLALDGNRRLYIADSFNNEIRVTYTVGYRIDKPLPSGMVFNNATGVISGTPNVLSPLTNYPVTAYNVYGSSRTSVDIEVLNTQTIAFNPIPPKIFCDHDFDPGATSPSQITYTSSDESVAKVVGNKIHIVGAGTTTITASDGTSTFPQTLTVAAAVVPSLTITPTSADDCSGNMVTFTATPVNGGDTPHYQWMVNGQSAGNDSPVFASSSLANNDKITCVLTSSACTLSAAATSNEATFVLDPPVSTSVTIVTSLTGPVCAGTEITFTATPSSADSSPAFQWQVNGVNAGGNSATFTSKTLADGDVVTCITTSKGKCLVNPAATSNAITVHFNPVSQCVITIPNTFTPNGDGINDFWNITALAYYPDCYLTVFTRYGSQVYRSVGYGKAWDGTTSGRALPVGTYYYILDLKNGTKPMSGPITIIK